MSQFSIRDTELADDSIKSNSNSEQKPLREPDFIFIFVSILILAFNFAILGVALITIGTKGYDPYIHLMSMLTSVLTLGCICAIHRYINGNHNGH